MINGPREVIISIATDKAAWEWVVPAGAHLVLLDEPVSRPGGIEVLDHSSERAFCRVLDTAQFTAKSFTIRLSGPSSGGGYTMAVEYGSPESTSSPETTFTSACSG